MNINNSKLAPDTGKTNNDSNDVFGMDLYYNTSDGHLTSQVYYDGKMASAKWMATNASGAKGNERAFVYGYDGVNRYTGETYSERATTVTSPFIVTHGWDENSIKYDANGNIQALRRDSSLQGTLTANSGILIDQLKYTYNSSIPDQLYTVYDSSGSAKGFIGGGSGSHYSYDANGNLTNEPYQGITGITYNVLNRTDSTKLSGTTYITYTYNAAGILLRKKAYNSGTLTQTDYIGGFVYTGNGTTQTLQYAPMPEGRLLGATLTQEYVITDPQGNARVAFQNVSGVAKVTQENSYYGYGLLMPGSLVGWSAPPNKNLYNGGSEWQNDTKAVNAGVPDYYQTYYRNYDPALARWVAVDPMAESAGSMGVYQYSGDNPIMGNDPGGDQLTAPGAGQYAQWDQQLQASFQGPSGGGGGGGGGYANPSDAIGRNSNPNWMNDGQFDDQGAFSHDNGAGGRAFWLGAEMSGGALNKVSASSLTQIESSVSTIVVGGTNSGLSVPLVTQLNRVELVLGQTYYVKNGVVYIQGTFSVVDADGDANQGGDPSSFKSSDNNSTLQNPIGPSLGSNPVHPFVVSFADPYVVLENDYGFKRVVAVTKPVGTILPSQWIDDNGLTVKATLLNIFWEKYPRLGGTTATGVLGYSINLQYSNGLSFHLDEFVTISYP